MYTMPSPRYYTIGDQRLYHYIFTSILQHLFELKVINKEYFEDNKDTDDIDVIIHVIDLAQNFLLANDRVITIGKQRPLWRITDAAGNVIKKKEYKQWYNLYFDALDDALQCLAANP